MVRFNRHIKEVKVMSKKMIVMVVMLLVLVLSNGNIMADNNTEFYVEGAPVIGEYIPDLQEESFAQQKSDLADKYYQLKVSSNRKLHIDNIFPVLNGISERLNIYQVPQEKNFWCGYAAIKSLLDYEKVYKSQETIASEVYSKSKACPWYLSNGDDASQFPVPNYLNQYVENFRYIAYPHGAAGTNPMSADTLKRKVIFTIDNKHGVLACGRSTGDNDSKLPGYPNDYIGHWLAIDGYRDYGNVIYIVDPAKSKVIPWSKNISAYYPVPVEKLAKFCETRGIVY